MARPFDERMPSHTGSSMSSQTNLNSYHTGLSSRDESYYPSSTQYNDDNGQLWVQRKNPPQPIHGSRLVKTRSSPSDGALSAAKSTSSHGRLHKRENSISGTDSPASQISDPNITANYNSQGISTLPSAVTDPLKSSKSTSRSKVKIKPLLRKLSAHDSTTVDLSRSTAEHEGLGIYTSSEYSGARPSADYPTSGLGRHQRTTSANSDRSTITFGNQRYGTNYVHPMRQTPRPYTPPIANSYKNSLDSEVSAAVPAITSSEGSHFDSPLRKPSPTPTPYAPLPSSRRIPPPLHVRTHSSSRITNSSQTNLPGTPSSLRLQSDHISTADAMSPDARSSLESAFHKRSRANTTNDPAAQAATVQALRQKFNEKEAAKDLRYQQAEAKAMEKEARRKERRDESQRRKSEGKERKRARSNAASEKSSVMNFGGQQYPVTTAPTTEEIPQPKQPTQQHRRRGETAGLAGKAVQSQWMLFWFKFKTMWLKLKRKMGSS